ncbi:MAG: TatD family hydrolase, partial [Methanomicrobiaceae archaeon]|nr:TatD family hydrolase [Methanomicrobiaceae archaeon]
MKPPRIPITDDHIHIDPVNGRGLAAAKDFLRAGGTHLFLVTKPSWSYGIEPSSGEDFAAGYDATLRVAESVREIGLSVFVILGVHPAEITRLAERLGLSRAAEVMAAGLDCAAAYVRDGRAVAIKSGRPHYPVDQETWDASNRVLRHALELGGDCGCAVQIHAESGPCADVAGM